MLELPIRIESVNGASDDTISVDELVIAGWTGRNKEAMEHHIAELEALGVKRPAHTPIYYAAAASRLTRAPTIEVLGGASTGEAEFVLLAGPRGLYVGVGSDHTDRKAETIGVTLSKQMCDKPIGAAVWPFEEVADHWDELVLRSHAMIDGERVLYQEGALKGMLPPDSLIHGYDAGGQLKPGTVMFGGTFVAIGGVRPATAFECELEDPVLNRRLTCRYAIRELPDRG
ncbi:DUF2848 domain-containing protein [Lutibaculum baratangense]|uniref:DUF2848 domain-containing protein n=1 Tax=Lutibaculum baratangense AMV1 TaxID=631454 RepID=V4QUP3_9HYPH|nr:DUF2848 domain-containing protein [Lutibaculum baratangense]ESR23452.1 hypothetical protein N177_3520 [Lutibaculum baratangense AMV1]